MSDDAEGGPRSADGAVPDHADTGWDFTRPLNTNAVPPTTPTTPTAGGGFGPVTLNAASEPGTETAARLDATVSDDTSAVPEPAVGAAAMTAGSADDTASTATGTGTAVAGRSRRGKNAREPMWKGRSVGDRIRLITSGVGQTLITSGLVILLFVAYEVWVTNIFANQKQHQVHEALAKEWSSGRDPLEGADKANLPAGQQVVLPTGTGFANLYIPAFGKDYAKTIVEGTDDASLEKGPGHYAKTAIPGQVGNFAIAGHRVGKGEPFLNLDQLKGKDAIIVQTATMWYVYDVISDGSDDAETKNASGIIGRSIVSPSDVGSDRAGTGSTQRDADQVAVDPDHLPSEVHRESAHDHPRRTGAQRAGRRHGHSQRNGRDALDVRLDLAASARPLVIAHPSGGHPGGRPERPAVVRGVSVGRAAVAVQPEPHQRQRRHGRQLAPPRAAFRCRSDSVVAN